MKANRWIAGTLLVVMLSGCATSRNSFYSDPMAVGDGQICRTLTSEEALADPAFQQDLRTELRMRGVNEADCGSIVQNENVAIGVGAVLGAAIVAAAASSGSGDHDHHHGRSHHGRESYIDIEIDIPPAPVEMGGWDQYQNTTGVLVWGCRGLQTKRLLDPARCSGQDMNDERWPAKTF